MNSARLRFSAAALLAPGFFAAAQMHRVAAPEQITRAVGVYEYVGDLQHPKAARLIPVSVFIGGHFEDAGVYLARPIPFALDGGLRYELQKSGVRQDFLDVVATRNFAQSAAAAATPFDDGWFGYGRVVPPSAAKPPGRLRPNCGNARTVQEGGTADKDDGKPHFGTKPAADDAPKARPGRDAAPDPCREDDADRPGKISLADDSKKDSNAPDPERPTLHRSPESSAHNTGAEGKPNKKAPKPPPATITANGGPADDPDRPTIRHRAADADDPNALPPDPMDLVGRERAKATAKSGTVPASAPPDTKPSDAMASANGTVAEGGSISSGNTMSGGPVLRRGRMTQPSPEPAAAKATSGSAVSAKVSGSTSAGSAIPEPLDAVVAISDAKDRPAHDFSYHFASLSERGAALATLQEMARAAVANPALATDAAEGAVAPKAAPVAGAQSTPAHSASRTGTRANARTGAAARTHAARPAPPASHLASLTFSDEELQAYQLYFSAPITYAYSARVPATATAPERFVTVIAQTDAEGKLQPAMRTVTDAAHLDRIPRYRMIDVVDADGSNRASLLMELRAQHSRQFALYRLLGNRPDQIFVSGSTLL